MDAAASEGESVLAELLEEETAKLRKLAQDFENGREERLNLQNWIMITEVQCKDSDERNRIAEDSKRKLVDELKFLKHQYESAGAWKRARAQERKLENQAQRLLELAKKLKEAENGARKAKAEKEKVEKLLGSVREVKERVRKERNYRRGRQGMANQTIVIQNKEVGPEQRLMGVRMIR